MNFLNKVEAKVKKVKAKPAKANKPKKAAKPAKAKSASKPKKSEKPVKFTGKESLAGNVKIPSAFPMMRKFLDPILEAKLAKVDSNQPLPERLGDIFFLVGPEVFTYFLMDLGMLERKDVAQTIRMLRTRIKR